MDAMVLVSAEGGYAGTTITLICARARVSRSTFYGCFESLEHCFLAIIDDGYRQARSLIAGAFEGTTCWQAGIRKALLSLLAFFDDEPLLARVWLIETLAAGGWALERRRQHVTGLTEMIVNRWPLPDGPIASPGAASAVMESMLGLTQQHLLGRRREPLVRLLPRLTGLVTALYLDAHAAAVEVERSEAVVSELLAQRPASANGASDVEIPATLIDPRAHRARACLLYVCEHPGVSNREVARAIGVPRDDQMSTMLSRLAGMAVLHKHSGHPGGPNAWAVTPYGSQVAATLRARLHDQRYDPKRQLISTDRVYRSNGLYLSGLPHDDN